MTKFFALSLSLLFVSVYGNTTTTTVVDIGSDPITGLCESKTVNETEYIDIVQEVETAPVECVSQVYDSKFTGKLVDLYGVPHKRVTIKAQGDNWLSQAMTDDNGEYTIEVKGDSNFFFSAYGASDDYVFYAFDTPLSVGAMNTSAKYICEYEIGSLNCYEDVI